MIPVGPHHRLLDAPRGDEIGHLEREHPERDETAAARRPNPDEAQRMKHGHHVTPSFSRSPRLGDQVVGREPFGPPAFAPAAGALALTGQEYHPVPEILDEHPVQIGSQSEILHRGEPACFSAYFYDPRSEPIIHTGQLGEHGRWRVVDIN